MVPILIGVTGHRDPVPADADKLREAVRAELMRIRGMCVRTGVGVRIVLISGLAEGSDRLAAEVALELGIELLAVLPMPQADYEKDFADSDSLDEFRELLSRAESVIELPWLHDDLQTEGTTVDVDPRVLQYERLGLFISSNCHILLALWDGKRLTKRGGTSDVVSMRAGIPGTANPKIFYSRSALPIGYGIQIVTPRLSQPEVTNPYARKPIHPEGWESPERAEQISEKVVQNTMELNADMADQREAHPEEIERSREWLFNDRSGIPDDPGLQACVDHYSVMDSLANRFKRLRVNTIATLFVLIIAAFIWFELHVKVFPHLPGMHLVVPVIGYVVLIAAVIYLYARAKRGRYDQKHEDYRVLAEALRVQIAWQIAGVSESVIDHCIPKQIGELSWIRIALFGFVHPFINKSRVAAASELEFIRTQWVEGQMEFYHRKNRINSHSVKRATKIGGTLLAASGGIALVLCVPFFSPLSSVHGWQMWVGKGMAMLAAALLAVAAARHGFAEMLAWAEQTHQYARMENVFGLANLTLVELRNLHRWDDMREVLVTLGQEALAEHGAWLIMHRARPLEVPRL
ncbi:hypothetical protein KQH82_13525 [bacterium]|nr:hypothetical protein [bacterium]